MRRISRLSPRALVAALLLVPLPLAAQTRDVARIRTPLGEILFVLDDRAPVHKEMFLRLTAQHYWDTFTFNRVIPNFVAQGGCPDTPEGFMHFPELLEPEFHDGLKHGYGAVGAGRDDNPGKLDPGCQFYIVANKRGLPRLDGNYTVFGQVIRGMDVVERIVHAPRDSTDTPLTPITLKIDILTVTPAELRRLEAGGP
jgi:peptidyl-prolyl cis-trans isomerase B (cyclophilin B)